MQIRIEGFDLPGGSFYPSQDSPGARHNAHVGVQHRTRRDELLGLVPGDAPSATWTLDCAASPAGAGTDLRGPYIQARPAAGSST